MVETARRQADSRIECPVIPFRRVLGYDLSLSIITKRSTAVFLALIRLLLLPPQAPSIHHNLLPSRKSALNRELGRPARLVFLDVDEEDAVVFLRRLRARQRPIPRAEPVMRKLPAFSPMFGWMVMLRYGLCHIWDS